MNQDVELSAASQPQRRAADGPAPPSPRSPPPPGPPGEPRLSCERLRAARGPHAQLPQLPPGLAIPLLREPSESSQLSGASGLGAHALLDTAELIDAARGLPPLREEERRRVMAPLIDGGEEALLQRLRFRLDRAGIAIPSQRVCYRGLTVTRRAAVGASAAVPTVGSVLRDALRAAVGRRRRSVITALAGATGVLRPRTMTLLLGPPGSGKTTLLRALTGRLERDRYTRLEGEVTHNGHPLASLAVQRSSAYVDQVDQHLPALTVRETLKFAERCLGGSVDAQDLMRRLAEWEAANGIEPTKEDAKADDLLAHLVVSHHLLTSDYVMEVFGLTRVADTLVGDAMLRGISGGERRRVTTAEMLVGPAQVIALDAVSNGLDSAVTHSILASMRRFAHTLEATVVASLLQPEPAVVALFDEVLLMSEGRVIWHGPADKALAHFSSLGFARPPDLGAADFLELVASPRDHGELTSRPASARGTAAAAAAASSGGGARPGSISGLSFARRGSRAGGLMTADQLASRFWASDTGQALMAEVKAPQEVPPDLDHAHLFTSRYGAPWPTLLAACLSRATTLEWRRNWPAAVVRWLLALVISIVAGSIFWRLPATFEGAVSAMGMLFWVLSFILVITVPTVELTYQRRPVVLRQRTNRFYAGWMEAVPQVLVNLPILAGDVIAVGAPVYWMVGFYPGAGRFFGFLAVLLGANVTADNFYRLLGAVMPNMHVGVAVGVTIYVAMELLAGFTISPAAIPQPWRTVYYLNPLAYAYRAAALNELRSPRWTSQPAPAAFGGPPATLSDALVAFFELEGGLGGGGGGGGGGSGAWLGIGLGALAAFAAAYVAGGMLAFSLFKAPATKAVVLEEGGAPGRVGGAAAASMKGEAAAGGAADDDDAFVVDAKALRAAAAADPSLQEELAPPIAPVTISFQDLRYFVPHPKKRGAELELLKGITGSFLPGKLVALMGSSGAGKTTLMDVIACRKTVGRVEGALSVNGAPLHAPSFARCAGYVEQSDVHAPLATVGEALRLAARLRLPAAFPGAGREEMVVEVMRLVELDELEGALVGKPGVDGLTTEQRKRLTIGVELVTNPSVLFLDEPSSGLDSRSAAVVMNVVAAVAALGRTVVATIHQPSASIFALFDELLLLQRGGSLVYSGPAAGVVPHLAALPGAPPFEEGRNPASWMLDAVAALLPAAGGGGGGGGDGAGGGLSLVQAYAASPLSRAAADRAAAAAAPPEAGGSAVRDDPAVTGPRPGVWVQFGEVMRRNLLTYWRDPGHNVSRYVITTILAVLVGWVEFGKGRQDHLVDARSVQNGMGAMYMLAISLAFEAAYEAQSGMVHDREVYVRERAAGTYGPGPYLAAQALMELPYLVPQAAVYTVIVYFLLGLEPAAGSFFFALLVVLASTGCMVLFAQALAHASPSPYLASLGLSVVGGSLFNVLCGFMAPLPTLPPWWRWFYYLNPMAYCLYAITAHQLGGVDRLMPSPTEAGASLPVNEYVAAVFGMRRGGAGVFPGAWGAVGMLGALGAAYFAASYLALRFRRQQKR